MGGSLLYTSGLTHKTGSMMTYYKCTILEISPVGRVAAAVLPGR